MSTPAVENKLLTLVAFLCVLVLFFPLKIFAASTDPHTYDSQWGSTGSGEGQFNVPAGMDVDSSGNIYVVEFTGSRVQKFTSSGTFVLEWGSAGSGNGQFSSPIDIAIDSNDNVYVTDRGNYRVQKFTSSGTFVTEWGTQGSGDGQFQAPYGIAVDSNDNIFVTDQSIGRVQKFTTDGTFISEFGSSGSGNGQFGQPNEIAIDSSNNLYITDANLDRIQKFNSSGTYVSKWGSNGSGNSQFSGINGIAVDSRGNVYAGDSLNTRIQKFDSNGNYLTKWGSLGTGDGQFSYSGDLSIFMVIDSGDNLYAADSWNDRIQKFAPADSPDSTSPTLSLSSSFDITSDSTPSLTGTATEAVGTVSNVQYQVDSTSGSWTTCTADDGTFDEATEAYTCTVSALSDGTHTVYIRTTDSNGNTTTSNYSSDALTVDTVAPRDFTVLRSAANNNYVGDTNSTVYGIEDGEVTNKDEFALTWDLEGDATSGVEKFYLFIRRVGKKFEKIKELTSSTDSYVVEKDEGDYEWYVEALDYAGNSSRTDIYSFEVDQTKPTTFGVDEINGVEANGDTLPLSPAESLSVAGTVEMGVDVHARLFDPSGTTMYQEIICGADEEIGGGVGIYKCQAPSSINTNYLLKVFTVDAAGNESQSTSINLTTQ